ncbi:hypothetical protein [Terrisporobacter sp.]|uniref:hypothetical protein n=1 Tax=Terrisporobacter sp. TaxID=1965305 RepID=UPI002897A6F1|nr:hypothetical protein [Terrisporobacter sp.]
MKVKLIKAADLTIMDQFSLNKNLQETIEYLKGQYECEIVCGCEIVSCYVRYIKG